jgi:hypothetical protein
MLKILEEYDCNEESISKLFNNDFCINIDTLEYYYNKHKHRNNYGNVIKSLMREGYFLIKFETFKFMVDHSTGINYSKLLTKYYSKSIEYYSKYFLCILDIKIIKYLVEKGATSHDCLIRFKDSQYNNNDMEIIKYLLSVSNGNIVEYFPKKYDKYKINYIKLLIELDTSNQLKEYIEGILKIAMEIKDNKFIRVLLLKR